MKLAKSLPKAFTDLEPFLDWALPSETRRRQHRESREFEEITEFYDAVLPRASAVFDFFRTAEAAAGGADKVDLETRTLFTLMLAFSEASLSVEMHKSPTVPDGMPGDIWKPEHETPGWKNKPKIKLMQRVAPTR
jgi:hypothetical protein